MEDRIKKLEEDVASLKARNMRVEGDKAWETSLTRALSIVGITYVVALLAFLAMDAGNPIGNAFIPAIGFALSIQSFPFIKRWWTKRYRKEMHHD